MHYAHPALTGHIDHHPVAIPAALAPYWADAHADLLADLGAAGYIVTITSEAVEVEVYSPVAGCYVGVDIIERDDADLIPARLGLLVDGAAS